MKQAIVIIHGIGNQQPMETLREFVSSVIGEDEQDEKPKFWNKPDRISNLLGLRKYTVPQKRYRPTTDFYEFYWAHLMKGTKLRHVRSWFWKLLFTNPQHFTFKIIPLWLLTWGLLIVGSILLVRGFIQESDPNTFNDNLGLGVLAYVFLLVINGIALKYIGDAARYLSPLPENIEVRQKIRSEGIRLLQNLHNSKKYDRIVVVGHSLGSVIGYDILTFLWANYNKTHKKPTEVDQSKLEEMELHALKIRNNKNPSKDDLQDFQALQRRLWLEQRRLGNKWLISDFVTLGSPLAHAQFLSNKSENELNKRQEERELPTCPPVLEDGRFIGYEDGTNYKVKVGEDEIIRSIRSLHHAALFGPTRWTNLYFWGDLIGGKLSKRFGKGIYDIEVRTRFIGGWTPFSHTKYWHFIPEFKMPQKGYHYLKALRNAIGLGSRRWIED